MAPQPKRKHSGHRGRVRSKVLKLSSVQLIACPSCGRKIHSHTICPFCGFYNGKTVIVKKQKAKKETSTTKNT